MNKNYRIKDIAAMAGVSTGTVDRILHNRGKVSIEAREKVDKVLKEIDYQPNLIARSLALKKKYHFITVIPHYTPGEYWEMLNKGIEQAEKELFSYNVEVERLCFNQYDKHSFDELIPEILEKECQGVVIATLIKESVLDLTRRLDEREIPYVFIDAQIEGANPVTYYGTHSYDSGYIAGRLLFDRISQAEDIAVFRFLRRGDFHSTQVSNRERGFRTYLEEKGHEGRIIPLSLHADDDENNKQLLKELFEKYPHLQKGIIFNSRAYLICDYLQEFPAVQFNLIGYDVLDANVNYLQEGVITHLIAQRPEVQGVNSIKALFRYLVLKETVDKINYMPIDILIKENIPYYNNYI
ncbi:MAG: LacI family DNA-binding transcriptional regulator [Tannerellaceae bacterium]|nr:LacI family DNA-binding transcriptional regulator [Tannerellaceae bacterium]